PTVAWQGVESARCLDNSDIGEPRRGFFDKVLLIGNAKCHPNPVWCKGIFLDIGAQRFTWETAVACFGRSAQRWRWINSACSGNAPLTKKLYHLAKPRKSSGTRIPSFAQLPFEAMQHVRARMHVSNLNKKTEKNRNRIYGALTRSLGTGCACQRLPYRFH